MLGILHLIVLNFSKNVSLVLGSFDIVKFGTE